MITVTEHSTRTLEVKQSKFIAHLMPYEMFDSVMVSLKEEHPKARHFVTGFRYLNEHDQIVEGCSDDGEPKGTSGKPTLAVLQGRELINVAVITVRYFGGTKLGTGGLVRAYSDATNMVIENAETATYEKEFTEVVRCGYSDMGIVEYELEQCGVKTVAKDFDATYVMLSLKGTRESLDTFYGQVKRLVTSL